MREPGIRIHHGDARLDAGLDLARRRPGARPLQAELAELARLAALTLGADVCSIYVREGEDVVMRANVGLPVAVPGHVRMRVGEGLTGLSVECMSPVSARLGSDPRSKAFPGLGEDAFPIFLAMPLLHGDHALGALVVQRKATPFAADELRTVALAAGLVVRHVSARAWSGGAMRLAGRGVGTGVVVGRLVEASFGPSDLTRRRGALGIADLRRALSEHAARAGRVHARLLTIPRTTRSAEALVLATPDAHIEDSLEALVAGGMPVEDAVASLAADAARGRPASGDPYLMARARDVEALGRLLLASARGERPRLPAGSVIVAERLAAPEALVCLEARVAGVALAAPAEQSSGLSLLEALGVPAVAGLEDLFHRARDGARAIVDADAGALVLDPSRSDLTIARRKRKRIATVAPPPASYLRRVR